MSEATLVCDLPGAQRTNLIGQSFDLGSIIHLYLRYYSPENELLWQELRQYRIVRAGDYWTAQAIWLGDSEEKRKDAIWQAVRDIANNSGGSEDP